MSGDGYLRGQPAPAAARQAAILTRMVYAEDLQAGMVLRIDFQEPAPRPEGPNAAMFGAVLYGTAPTRREESVVVKDVRTYEQFGVVSAVLVREDGRQVGAQWHVFHLLVAVDEVPT